MYGGHYVRGGGHYVRGGGHYVLEGRDPDFFNKFELKLVAPDELQG